MAIRVKRVYEDPGEDDGARVLVDRLWPRGVAREDADLDRWMRSIAPSDDLREWFGHDPDRWPEFRRRYREELAACDDSVEDLLDLAASGDLTLVYAARDREHNNAVVLREFLVERGGDGVA